MSAFHRALPIFIINLIVSIAHVSFGGQSVQKDTVAPTQGTGVSPKGSTLSTETRTDNTKQETVIARSEGLQNQGSQLTTGGLDSIQPNGSKNTGEPLSPPQSDKLPVNTLPSASQDKFSDVELLPHRATYNVTLDKSHSDEKNYPDEDIENANGQMTIQLAKAGDGWAVEQKLILHIYYKDGSAEQVITNLATYESLDGLKYNFNVRTLRGDLEETISGDAILASKGGAGIVTYQQPDESTIQLPVGTVFPTQHLIYALSAAMRGQKVVSNIVFDGSSETHEPVQVNTILGASQEPKLALTDKNLLQFKKLWPMRMAVYAVDGPSAEPDYEIKQNVLDRGVIRDMTLDYGTFKVKAVLVDIVVFS